MLSHEAVPWFQITDSGVCIAGTFNLPFFLIALLGLATWVLGRAASAIVGEYSKRVWFTGWRDELRKAKSEMAALKSTIEAERQQYAVERRLTEELIIENDRLLKRVLELQVTLSQQRTG